MTILSPVVAVQSAREKNFEAGGIKRWCDLNGDATMADATIDGEKFGDERQPRSRRLTDKILNAFHQACDQGDFETAQKLLEIVEDILKRSPQLPSRERRKTIEHLIAAHERLWTLRAFRGTIQ
jgi:hypothetical protein